MKLTLTFIFCLLLTQINAQSIDQDRMDKDLEVSENILGTVISQSSKKKGRYFHSDRGIEASYLKDFGVIYRLENQHMIWGFISGDNDNVVIVEGDEGGKATAKSGSSNDLKNAIKDFLVDYGGLIKQLQPDDKILVKSGSSGGRSHVVWNSGKGKKMSEGLSIEVTKADLNAFESGDLSREQILDKIVVKESSIDHQKEPQLEVFSSLIDRLYDEDLSDTYYLANHPTYERVEDFGVTYFLKFYSSQIHDNDLYTLPTVDKVKISKEERDKIVDDMYPKFLDSMKENILEYGHTLKNLDESEMLIFDIKLTSCDPCAMPARIEMSLSKSLIEEYRSQNINLSDAMAKITVTKVS